MDSSKQYNLCRFDEGAKYCTGMVNLYGILMGSHFRNDNFKHLVITVKR